MSAGAKQPGLADSNHVIKSARLTLSPVTAADEEDIYSLRSNPKVFYWRTPDTREQSAQWLHDRLHSGEPPSYCICLPLLGDSTQHSLSKGGLDVINSPSGWEEPSRLRVIGAIGPAGFPEIGYILEPSAWGKGYATEALQAWLSAYWQQWPDGHPSLPSDSRTLLMAQTGPEAGASRRVLERNGFRHVGHSQVEEEGKQVMLDDWRFDRASA